MKRIFYVLIFLSIPSLAGQKNFGDILNIPFNVDNINTTPGLTNPTIDADGEKTSSVFQINRPISVQRIGFQFNTITTGGDLNARLETFDFDTGNPSGNLVCSGSSATLTTANNDDNSTIYSSSFSGVSCDLTPGVAYTVVIERLAGSTFNGTIVSFADSNLSFPIRITSNTTAGWTKSVNATGFSFILTDGTYFVPYGIFQMPNILTNSFNMNSTPDEIGNYFIFDFGFTSPGPWVWIDSDNHYAINLRENNVLIASVTAISSATAGAAASYEAYGWIGGQVQIKPNVPYRLTVEPTTAGNVAIYDNVYTSTAVKNGDVLGMKFMKTSAKNPVSESSWTNQELRTAWMGFMVSSFDIPKPSVYAVSQ